MLHIKMPFGYNSFCFDHSFVIHTGKIRIKADYLYISDTLGHHSSLQFKPSGNDGQYTVISFTTTCKETNDFLIRQINELLCKIMHERIDAKYAPKVLEPEIVHPLDWSEFAL